MKTNFPVALTVMTRERSREASEGQLLPLLRLARNVVPLILKFEALQTKWR